MSFTTTLSSPTPLTRPHHSSHAPHRTISFPMATVIHRNLNPIRRRSLAVVAAVRQQDTTVWTPTPLSGVKPASESLFHVTIDVSDSPDLASSYTLAGQYLQLRIPNVEKPAFLAIASPPSLAFTNGVFEFLVKSITGSTAEVLCGLRKGDVVELSPVMGKGFNTDEISPPEDYQSVLIFATGSGISPIRSLIESGFSADKRSDVRLYYGARNLQRMAYQDRFKSWESSGVTIVPVLSQPDDSWAGEAGYVQVFKTISIAKMKNLKFLFLEYVKLTGTYENFPELIWLRWSKCNLKTIPPGLLMSSLVAIEMRFGNLEEFEPPMVLHSLKILDLSRSYKLVSIRNLHRLPKLECLFLLYCTSFTYVCDTIGKLENLHVLGLGGCTQLWKALSNQKFVNQQERPLFSLPQSLRCLSLRSNKWEIMPSYIGLKNLTSLVIYPCPKLKSLTCLPSTLKVLHVDWCSSLKNITFQSARFTLQEFSYEGCFKLCEVEGLFKLVSIAKLGEADLGHMKWIKSYQDHKVDLIGDEITNGRTFNIQMLYEYGIRSAYLQGIKDQSMVTHDYTSSSDILSFVVPLHSKKNRIQGLNLTIIYKWSTVEVGNIWHRFVKISNRTKGVTWVYHPVVFCKPVNENDVVWLSYWPIGNELDANDELHVCILMDKNELIVKECGVSLVYMDDGEEKEEEKCDERMRGEEVIGGDLSLLEVTKGGYYLCRKNYFNNSMIPNCFFGSTIRISAVSRRWRVHGSHISQHEEMNAIRNPNRHKYEVTLAVSFNSESETDKIEKAVSSVEGVEYVHIENETGRLIVSGCFEFHSVITCVKEFEKIVQVVYYKRV